MAMTDEPKKIVIDMAGVMEKLTPEMFDAAKDAMIEALIKGGTEWRNRAEAAEAALAAARDEGRREGLEEAARMVPDYAAQMLDAPIYGYPGPNEGEVATIPFSDFGPAVDASDAAELGVDLACAGKFSAYSDIRNDEIRDTQTAVLCKALEPLAASIRALIGEGRGNG
jgi:hypothetical protein